MRRLGKCRLGGRIIMLRKILKWYRDLMAKDVCPHFCSLDVPYSECEKYRCPDKIMK